MNIVGFVMVGTNDLEKSREFYDAVLVHLELRKVTITERYIGYGHSDDDLAVKFYITKPYDKNNASVGNGTMVALSAVSKDAVNKFHKTALEIGAIDEGTPGERSDGNYYAYVRDPDGNKIAARCVLKK